VHILRLVGFFTGPAMVGLNGLNKRQEIEIKILARIIECAEIESADRVEPFGLREPVLKQSFSSPFISVSAKRNSSVRGLWPAALRTG
jgi:hypothetical protein